MSWPTNRPLWGVLLLLAAGCSQQPTNYAPPEVGWHVDAINKVQGDKAKTDELVIYQYEWADGPRLTAYGERHLGQMEASIAHGTVPADTAVVIEPSGDAALDSTRAATINGLFRRQTPALMVAVVVARPNAHGIEGIEAANVDADTPRGGQTNGANGTNGTQNSGFGGGLGGSSGGIGTGGIGMGGL